MTSSSDPRGGGYLVAVNGSSGSCDPDLVAAACDRLAAAGRLEQRETAQPSDLDALFDELDGRMLVVMGGDGSIHTAVRRAHQLGVLGAVTFGLIPTGTGNDLARSVGLPLDPEEAAAALVSGRERAMDLVTYGDDHVVINAVHAGIGADAAERAQPMKQAMGDLAYPVGAVAAGVAVEGWDVEVEVDGRPLRPDDGDRTLMVAIGNGSTIGGGTAICPDARPDDGELDVVVSRALSPTARTGYAAALLRGTHGERDDVATARGRRITIRGGAIPYNVDGELVGSHDDVTFTIDPGAWRLVTP